MALHKRGRTDDVYDPAYAIALDNRARNRPSPAACRPLSASRALHASQ